MSKNRKDVIVDEIRYWKENKLLPDKYCDFLLALYTEGESGADKEKKVSRTSPWLATYYSVNFLLIPLSFTVIYFTENGIILQSLLLTGFAASSFLMQSLIKKENAPVELPLVITLIIVFLLTTSSAAYYFPVIYAEGVALLNAVGWMTIGMRRGLFYVKVSGIALLAGTLISMLIR
ncbi:hypothetical protein [Salimicrobium jeotgali]|uniref:hypothetical protein n=1 Tax=Salimicrobium jeotgali TaxID=1230341 RepID=UPI000C85E0EE|nr:hypothetical protein [Salimicrobium jeotgali]